MIQKLLIANRGEIALRVARSAREMGIATVGVVSEADRQSRHGQEVDEAYFLGASAPSESYLNQQKILEIAKQSGADAIHPGYGFLSENAGFAQRVLDSGLKWVGPTPEVIELMGDKIAARKTAKKLDVPVIPGVEEAVEDPAQLRRIAEQLGYPVLLKASGGGGGKGIRLVHEQARLASELAMAQSEARKAFGHPAIFIEKAMLNVRHIELQIFGTADGRFLHFGERECSLQRRHQKVVEEAPSPISSPSLRRKLVDAGRKLVAGISYQNAGTLEFLVDDRENVYFLEMNTRLQVEHGVTEAISGVDLVREQLLAASGIASELQQRQIQFNGHAIELRVYAEDPFRGFLPQAGEIRDLALPEGPFIRVDTALFAGESVSLHYDPMLAKLIAWGADRQQCIDRLARAAEDFVITGPRTSLPLISKLAKNEQFRSGQFHTKWLDEFCSQLEAPNPALIRKTALAAALFVDSQKTGSAPSMSSTPAISSRPRSESGYGGAASAWALSGRGRRRF